MNGFRDRQDAGRQLAAKLRPLAAERPIVVALPRGGVPVAYEIAGALHAPLDVLVVRKVGVPWHPELGVGAVSEGGYVELNEDVLAHVGLSDDELRAAIETKQREVAERVRLFRDGHPPQPLRGRVVVLVDDGIATGGTVRVAIRAIRAQTPKAIVLAVPVASPDVLDSLAPEVDQTVCLRMPGDLYAIGLWYLDFSQVADDQVVRLLEAARRDEANPDLPA